MKSILAVGVALFALFALAMAPASAQNGGGRHHGHGVHWQGVVDDRVEIVIQGSQVRSHVRSGNAVGHMSYEVEQPLPNAPVQVYLRRVSGRGTVRVFQQPNQGNGFTAGVRIHDLKPGSASYSFTLDWH